MEKASQCQWRLARKSHLNSRTPERRRQKERLPEIVDSILNYRKFHPRLGKEKLKPIVDKFCLEWWLRPVSVSTINKIISYFKRRTSLRSLGMWLLLKARGVKTGNGSEFSGKFEPYFRSAEFEHYFKYPSYTKGNVNGGEVQQEVT